MPALETIGQITNNSLSTSKAAKLLGVSPTTLRRYEKKGLIKAHRKPNGYRAFYTDDIASLKQSLSKQEQKAQKELHLELLDLQEKEITKKKTTPKPSPEYLTQLSHQEQTPDDKPEKLHKGFKPVSEEEITAPLKDKSTHTEIPLEAALASIEAQTAAESILPEEPAKFIRYDQDAHKIRVLEVKNVFKSRLIKVSAVAMMITFSAF